MKAQVVTYNYIFEMTQISGDNQTAEYRFPHLLDASPLIIVITGLNESSTFAEWVSTEVEVSVHASDQREIDVQANVTWGEV